MSGSPFVTRAPDTFIKRVQFDGTTDKGAIGASVVASVSGRVLIHELAVYCWADCQPAVSAISLGVAGNAEGLIITTLVNSIDSGEYWVGVASPFGTYAAFVNRVVASDIILTVGAGAVTSGGLEYQIRWQAMSADGDLR